MSGKRQKRFKITSKHSSTSQTISYKMAQQQHSNCSRLIHDAPQPIRCSARLDRSRLLVINAQLQWRFRSSAVHGEPIYDLQPIKNSSFIRGTDVVWLCGMLLCSLFDSAFCLLSCAVAVLRWGWWLDVPQTFARPTKISCQPAAYVSSHFNELR